MSARRTTNVARDTPRIGTRCPRCGKEGTIPASYLGREIICPACSTNFTATDLKDQETLCDNDEIVTALIVDQAIVRDAGNCDAEPLTAEIAQQQSTLSNDLVRYSQELYTKRDLESGLRIVKEVVGLIAVGGFAISALTIWLPAVGITLSTAAIARIIVQLARFYHDASEDERKQIRAAVSWIRCGFNLGDRLLG